MRLSSFVRRVAFVAQTGPVEQANVVDFPAHRLSEAGEAPRGFNRHEPR